jgi:hypothetical protein
MKFFDSQECAEGCLNDLLKKVDEEIFLIETGKQMIPFANKRSIIEAIK